jgi:hypothetical protein
MSAKAHTATVKPKCWRCKPMRKTWAFCGPMAMMSDRLSTMPAAKVGKVMTMVGSKTSNAMAAIVVNNPV